MREQGSVLLYVHGNHQARSGGESRTATSTSTQLLNSGKGFIGPLPVYGQSMALPRPGEYEFMSHPAAVTTTTTTSLAEVLLFVT